MSAGKLSTVRNGGSRRLAAVIAAVEGFSMAMRHQHASNSAAWHSPASAAVRELPKHDPVTTGERRRTVMIETTIETTASGVSMS
jgi:hypothetical protein